VEGEKPEKTAYPVKGKMLNMPAIFLALPEFVRLGEKDKIR